MYSNKYQLAKSAQSQFFEACKNKENPLLYNFNEKPAVTKICRVLDKMLESQEDLMCTILTTNSFQNILKLHKLNTNIKNK